MPPAPIVLSPALPSELLEYVLAHQTYPTTLIICGQRTAFLSSLLEATKHSCDSQDTAVQPIELDPQQHEEPVSRNSLLVPTLHQLATSRYITTSFTPTVSHLRAYLSVLPGPTKQPEEQPSIPKFDRRGRKVPLLVVYGFLELHRDTSEWSAQGLSNSLSALVEAGARIGKRVVVLEERALEVVDGGTIDYGEVSNEIGEEEGDEQLRDVNSEDEGKSARREVWKGWKERVPMLNGNVRRAGLESDDGSWSGRTVDVGRIFGRWFKLGRGNWDMANAP